MQRQDENNAEKLSERLLNHWEAEKKKIVAAASLVVLMAVMWIRVLSGGGPDSAAGAQSTNKQENEKKQAKLKFKELPVIEGRHDALAGNFFKIKSWDEFLGYKKSQEVVSQAEQAEEDDARMLKRLSEKMKLQAIEMGTSPQVFMNDELLEQGETFVVEDKGEKYECKVVEIKRDKVCIECGELVIKLQFAETFRDNGNQ